MIYFDNAATTPPKDEVIRVVTDFLSHGWGNPSSLHRKGLDANRALEKARKSVAECLHTDALKIVFTSGATESNNLAILSAMDGGNIVASPIEHASVLETLKGDVRYLSVDEKGHVDLNDIERLVDADTSLFALMQVNNELGSIQDVVEAAKRVKTVNPNTKVLVDGAQGLGKIAIDLEKSQIDFYTASGHKIHAPKGVGMLWIRDTVSFQPTFFGGGQEKGMRPGTENLPYICAFAQALERMTDTNEVSDISEYLRCRLAKIPLCRIISPEDGSPYILSAAFKDLKGEVLMRTLSDRGVFVSTGSACSKGKLSHVIKATGVDSRYAQGTIRISVSHENTMDEAKAFLEILEEALAFLGPIMRRGKMKE